jgi:hypothetical protein
MQQKSKPSSLEKETDSLQTLEIANNSFLSPAWQI